MSGLSKINMDRIDSHASVTAMTRAIADLIKNPPDTKQAMEDAHKVIQQAKDDMAALNKAKLDFNAASAATRDEFNARARDLENRENKTESEGRTISLRMQELETAKVLIETRKSELSAQDERSRVREETSRNKERGLLEYEKTLHVFEATLKGKEQLIEEKERSISDREGKLRQILG